MKDPRRSSPDLERVTHCDDVTRLVWPFLDDELTPRVATSMRVHLRACATCRAFVRFERAFLTAMQAALRSSRGNLHHEPRVSAPSQNDSQTEKR